MPSLKTEGRTSDEPLSLREAMTLHRQNPACAGCHAKIDPIGFALENFDGIGNWRTREANADIDPSGTLPDGTPFKGADGLKKILIDKRRDQFVATVTERMLTYALGRGVEYEDMPVIRSIVRDAQKDNYRFMSILMGIINSDPFNKRVKQVEEAQN